MKAPSYSTGPVISTWSSEPRHSMTSSPPGRRTFPLRSMSPRRDAATTVAQAAEPQASVSPAPRSHTSALTSSRARTWAKVTLAFSGKIGSASIRGPRSAASMRSRSGTKNTACGLPMLTSEAGPSSAGPQIHPPRVRDGAQNRNGVPFEARRAHVDPVGPFSEPLASDRSGRGRDLDRADAELAAEPVGDAARPIAAGAGERAVVIEDEGVRRGSRGPGVAENHHLIISEAQRAMNRAGVFRR